MTKTQEQELRDKLVSDMNVHEDIGEWFRKEGYAADYVINMKCVDIADFLISYIRERDLRIEGEIEAIEIMEQRLSGHIMSAAIGFNEARKKALEILRKHRLTNGKK